MIRTTTHDVAIKLKKAVLKAKNDTLDGDANKWMNIEYSRFTEAWRTPKCLRMDRKFLLTL